MDQQPFVPIPVGGYLNQALDGCSIKPMSTLIRTKYLCFKFSCQMLPVALAILAAFISLQPLCLAASNKASEFEKDFLHPPDSARPWVYWFWLNGNISSNGITADLEAMKRVGIGGVLIMEVDQGTPKGPAAFAGPQWRDLFKHVCS